MSNLRPYGGTPDFIIDLRQAGYCSTSELSDKVGAGKLSATWIINELGVKPSLMVRNGQAYYWTPDQVKQVRKALIKKLVEATS